MGLDLFESDVVLRKLMPKLLRSHALDALDTSDARAPKPIGAAARQNAARKFAVSVSKAAQGNARTFPTVGLGETMRVDDGAGAAAALVLDGAVIHSGGVRPGSRMRKVAKVLAFQTNTDRRPGPRVEPGPSVFGRFSASRQSGARGDKQRHLRTSYLELSGSLATVYQAGWALNSRSAGTAIAKFLTSVPLYVIRARSA